MDAADSPPPTVDVGGGIDIAYEARGPADGPVLVMVAGIYQQLSFWPGHFVERLTDAGLRVVVHDNRDVGFSTREARPAPDPLEVAEGRASANYTLADMAGDTIALIEARCSTPVHLLGHSMGGMISQHVAVTRPDLLDSLVLVSTAPNDGTTGQPSPEFAAGLESSGAGPDAVIEAGYRMCALPDPIDEERLASYARLQQSRAPNPAQQCLPAIAASRRAGTVAPTHDDALAALTCRTLVIHGTGDLLVAADGGHRLADLIPDAALLEVSGMGHIPLDPARWAMMADAVLAHVAR